MKKKSKKLISLIIVVLVIVIAGGILAYLTDTDEATNVFTMGKVDIELTETAWNPSNGQNIVPNQPISKNPKINNIGNNPAYVYIKVVNPIVTLTTGEGPLFSYTTNTGWTQLDQVEQCGYRATTYYYNTALNPSASTATLFDTVIVNEFRGSIDSNQVLDIYGYGIQSTYLESGSTVTSIFSDAFSTGLSDTDESCPSVTDCSNNEMYTTAPSRLKGLAKIMAKDAYLDNGKSEYVNSCNGVDFSNISSDTNGKGIYEIASTKNDTYPIYYYRGAVENNNVKFGGFCWKAIRTTDTGGVKLIYNGEPDGDGNCTNTTGTSTQITKNSFSSYSNSLVGVGYMLNYMYSHSSRPSSSLSTPYVYGNDVTYSGGTYTLIDTMTSTGTWATDYNTLTNNHYTCFSTGATCISVYYVFITNTSYLFYISLSQGKKVNDALSEMFNEENSIFTNSSIKSKIDNWYNTNLSSYTNYIEDTVYCNDRSIGGLGGWDPNGGITSAGLTFSPRKKLYSTYIPSLDCSRMLDRFTVSSVIGNGALTYPVGLITSDEVMYAGGTGSTVNNSFFLYTYQDYWTVSPSHYHGNGSPSINVTMVSSSGMISYNTVTKSLGIRPVISLKSTDVVSSGDGTSTNPYVINTN